MSPGMEEPKGVIASIFLKRGEHAAEERRVAAALPAKTLHLVNGAYQKYVDALGLRRPP